MLKRMDGWEDRMNTVIDASRNIPFGYSAGEQNCCRFVFSVIEALVGINLFWLDGKYTTKREAYRLARNDSVFTAGDVMRKVGLQLIPVALAQRGDVIELSNGALGICVGKTIAVVNNPFGLRFMPVVNAVSAWRV